ncbi:MAG: hypothetical protein AB7O98_17505 [Hyphomonadaceae bacterium]
MSVRVKSAEFGDLCVFQVHVCTNGEQGGNRSHGGYASITFQDLGSTGIDAAVDRRRFKYVNEVTVRLCGDAEIRAMRRALLFAAHALDEMLDDIERENAQKAARPFPWPSP